MKHSHIFFHPGILVSILVLILSACQPSTDRQLPEGTPLPDPPETAATAFLPEAAATHTPLPLAVSSPVAIPATPTPEAVMTPTAVEAAEPAQSEPTQEASQPTLTALVPGSGPLPEFSPQVRLELFASGFSAPIGLIPAGDGTGRLFVIDQVGVIHLLSETGEVQPDAFLDLRDRMVDLRPGYDERGLLGLAFHPRFSDNGRFFVYYSAPLQPGGPAGWDHTSHVSEFSVSAHSADQADPDSERLLLRIDQPQANHNGGQIVFGPDGYLYIPLGDGGGANDTGMGHSPQGNGQDPSNWLGSILRIDVDQGDPYGIPTGNPFAGDPGIPGETFAYGFRNPFRISFDAGGDGSLYASDAGQNRWEEVSRVAAGGNYGWNQKEGSHCFDPADASASQAGCSQTGLRGEPLIDPVIEYPHASQGGFGLVIIGGYVYRGETLPGFQGRYIFGDWSTSFGVGNGILLVASPPEIGDGLWAVEPLEITGLQGGRLGEFLLSFGQDENLELYVLTTSQPGPTGSSGRIYRLAP